MAKSIEFLGGPYRVLWGFRGFAADGFLWPDLSGLTTALAASLEMARKSRASNSELGSCRSYPALPMATGLNGQGLA